MHADASVHVTEEQGTASGAGEGHIDPPAIVDEPQADPLLALTKERRTISASCPWEASTVRTSAR